METTTVGGHDAYLYPNEPDDTVLKGCVILRGRYPWHTTESRHLVEWNIKTGKCIFTDRFGKKYVDPKFTDWDLIGYETEVKKEVNNVEESCSRSRSFWRSFWDRWVRS